MSRVMQFLIGLLSGKSGGIILGVTAAVVSALVAYAGWQSWRLHSLRADLAAEVAERAQCEAQKAVAMANASRLADAIGEQNRKIAELQQQADAVAAADEMKAERVLRDGQVRQQQIHDSDGVGPEVMNAWFADRL